MLTAVEGLAMALNGGISVATEEEPESDSGDVDGVLAEEDEAEACEESDEEGELVVVLDGVPASFNESEPDPDEIKDLTASM